MRIDLHTHTTASDGTDSPSALLRAAKSAGVDIVAITDHDTTSGWAPAAEGLPETMALVRGMEMSCVGRDAAGAPVPVHLLAYLFDPEAPEFAAERVRLRSERSRRIIEMATRMAVDGLPVDPDEIVAEAGPAVGRPHLAQALIRGGVVSSTDEAFAGLLSTRSPYYVDKADTPLEDAVTLVSDAGGVSVIAHPLAAARGRVMDLAQVAELVPRGLDGIEVDHPEHDPADCARLAELAAELDLIRTGSSDYHGSNKSTALGARTTDPAQFERLLARAGGAELLVGPEFDTTAVRG